MYTSDIERPVIKAFIYNGEYYLYDTYTNRLFGIPKDEYTEIKMLEKIGFDAYLNNPKDTRSYKNVVMLLSKGMLRKPFVQEISHSETQYVKQLTDRCVNDLTLQVTKDCNFACRYCTFSCNSNMARNHEKTNMPWNIAKRCIDFLYSHSSDMNTVTISFYGGEPLLNYELITQVVEYSEKLFQSKRVDFVMTTNGSILTDKMIDFLAEHRFLLTLSFDGPPDIQNYHRKFLTNGEGTHDLVYRNIMRLKARKPDYYNSFVSMNPVVFYDEDKEQILEYHMDRFGLPKKRITLRDATMNGIDYIPSHIGDKSKKTDNDILEVFPEELEDTFRNIYNNKENVSTIWHHNGPCVPSVRMIFADVNGCFYPCEKCPEEDYFLIGDINNGLKMNKIIDLMNIGKMSIKKCQTCWAMRFCNICSIRCYDYDRQTITYEKKQKACREEQEKVLLFLEEMIKSKR